MFFPKCFPLFFSLYVSGDRHSVNAILKVMARKEMDVNAKCFSGAEASIRKGAGGSNARGQHAGDLWTAMDCAIEYVLCVCMFIVFSINTHL